MVRWRKGESANGDGQLSEFVVRGRTRQCVAWFIAVAFGTAVLVLRRPGAVIHPSLHAEDGPIFLRSAYLDPAWRSISRPYNGYVHVLLRVWAEVTTALPATSLALSYTLFSLVSAAACYSIVLSRRLRWLLPSDAWRLVVFVVFLSLPGTREITGNLTNLLWPVAVGLVLLSLSDQPQTTAGRVAEHFAVVGLALTGAAILLVAPSFVFRYRRTRTRHDLALLGPVVACAGLQAASLLFSHQRSGTGVHLALRTIVRASLIRVWGTLAVGEKNLAGIAPNRLPIAFLAVCVAGVAISAVGLLVASRHFRLQWLSIFGLSIGSTAWAYGGTLQQMAYSGVNAGRYFLVPIVLVVVGVAASCARLNGLGRLRYVLAVPVAAIFGFAVVSDLLLAPVQSTHWATTARCVREHRTCHVEVDPESFSFTLPPVSGAH